MTAIYIRAADGVRWCRLVVVGRDYHGTACMLGGVATDEPILLSADPPLEDRCKACERDLEIKRARVPTVDLRPRVRGGEVADLEVDMAVAMEPAIGRTPTAEW